MSFGKLKQGPQAKFTKALTNDNVLNMIEVTYTHVLCALC